VELQVLQVQMVIKELMVEMELQVKVVLQVQMVQMVTKEQMEEMELLV
jgi:hypothetical protein